MSANKSQIKAWAKEIEENWKSQELDDDAGWEEFFELLYHPTAWDVYDWRASLADNIYSLGRLLTVEEAKTLTLMLRKKFPLSV